MTAYQPNSANSTRAARANPAITALITALHKVLSDIIIDPRDHRSYERADELCQEIWQTCTTRYETPWKYCLDRYCSCKLMLSEWEPDQLDLYERNGRRVGGAHRPS